MDAIMQQIGRYEILRELGRGAMGIVYAAIDPLIGRLVAIKTIRLDTLATADHHAELTRRLYREAQSAGTLSHPGIITIHDVGERGNVAYIVMEYVDGTNLEEILDSGVPQHSGTLLSILRQAAAALDYAHGKGIIHRDIKPSNIMICRDGAIKIADFGVAKLSASTSMTQAGLVLGTPSYMSPEQAQGLTIDGRADQFSLGVVAYRALTGVLPFQGPTLTALLAKILMEEPQYEDAGLHPYLQFVFKRVLAKDPHARFQNCAEFIHDLEDSYALYKGEKPDGALRSEEQAPALADLNAVRPIAGLNNKSNAPEAAIPVPSEAEEIAKKDVSAPAPLIAQVQQSPAADEMKIPPLSPPPSEPEAPKRKSMLTAWIVSLAVLAVAVIAFLIIKAPQKPISSDQDSHPNIAAVAPIKPLQEDQAKVQENAQSETVTSQTQRAEGPASQPKSAPSDANKIVPEKDAASKLDQAETARKSAYPVSGTIIWTGNLGKNSVLVISAQKASIGSVTGELPGRPVSISVDPSDLVIRQMPDQVNEWKQIMLYSGSKKYTSITIRWKTTR